MSPRGKVLNDTMRSETLQKITGGALSIFAEYGFYGATMKKIAEATGLSYGLIYHYFKSKEEVFIYLVNLALMKTREIFEKSLTQDGDPWEDLNTLSKTLIEESLTGDSVLFFHIMLQALAQGKHLPELKEHIDKNSQLIFEKMIHVVVKGQAVGKVVEGNPIALITSYLSMIQGLALYMFQDGSIPSIITHEYLLNVLRK